MPVCLYFLEEGEATKVHTSQSSFPDPSAEGRCFMLDGCEPFGYPTQKEIYLLQSGGSVRKVMIK